MKLTPTQADVICKMREHSTLFDYGFCYELTLGGRVRGETVDALFRKGFIEKSPVSHDVLILTKLGRTVEID